MAMLSSKKRESRKSLSQPGWITLEGREGHDRRPQLAADEVAAGVFARRQDRTRLRSGLAPRQIGRRQVRPLGGQFR
jgi:hypothetical protein